MSDAAGALKVRLSYGAFGKRRNEAGWAGAVPVGDLTGIANTTRHGYTEHEMLDNLTLIHMNGRVFDPTVGRFLSADPFVQAPDFSQSLNRYSYVWNNPLSFTDPSGFETEGGAPFRFGFGYGAVRVAHHRYPAPHMQPPPRRDAPVGRDTQGGAPEITGQSAADAGCLPSGAGATPNWNPAADACSDAAAHDETVDEEQRARAGRASGARAVAEISSEAADVADEYARDTVKYGALYYVLRWLGIGRAAKAAPNPPFRNGDVILRTFNTSKGPLDMAAEVQISGRTLHLKDVAVFPRGAESLSLGTREIAALRNQLADEARRLGFDQLRITGTRVTGANPGKQVDILIDLTGGP